MADKALLVVDGILLTIGAGLFVKSVLSRLASDDEDETDLRGEALKNQNILALRSKEISSNAQMVQHLQRKWLLILVNFLFG